MSIDLPPMSVSSTAVPRKVPKRKPKASRIGKNRPRDRQAPRQARSLQIGKKRHNRTSFVPFAPGLLYDTSTVYIINPRGDE